LNLNIEESDSEESESESEELKEKEDLIQYEKKKNMYLIRKLKEYYKFTYFSSPSSKIMFDLSIVLNKNNNNHLWLGIIGIFFF
jgi:hypothetical protein